MNSITKKLKLIYNLLKCEADSQKLFKVLAKKWYNKLKYYKKTDNLEYNRYLNKINIKINKIKNAIELKGGGDKKDVVIMLNMEQERMAYRMLNNY